MKTTCGILFALVLVISPVLLSFQHPSILAEGGYTAVSLVKEQVVSVVFPFPHIQSVDEFAWLTVENCTYLMEPGQPMLPVRTLVFKIPLGSVVSAVEVTSNDRLLPGRFQILPVPTPTVVGSETENRFTKNQTTYASHRPFPYQSYSYRTTQGLDPDTNTRVQYLIVNLFPLRYLPAQQTIMRTKDVTVTVTYIEPPESLSSGPTLENIIIVSPSLEASALDLAAWKNTTGILSRVVNTTWIYSHYSGVDEPEQIRTCINDYVINHGIRSVTLFGDADQVPVRLAYIPDLGGEETYVATDLYYADLDGTWDDNGDGLFADQAHDTIDGIPDVYVGRIPPSLIESAQIAVNKIQAYAQHGDAALDWNQRIVLAAATGSGNGLTDPFGVAFPVLKDYIADTTFEHNVVKLYASAGNLTTVSLTTVFNEGALFVNFAGHGSPDSWLLDWILPPLVYEDFGVSDVQSLHNGIKLPVVTTMSCSTARFDDAECLGERFVLEPDGGAIAYFGATRLAYAYVGEFCPFGLSGELDRRLYEAFYGGVTRLGPLWATALTEYVQSHISEYASASMYDVKTVLEFTLLGDPTLRIPRLGHPETLTVPDQYPSIQTAINAAYPGDTVFVKSGSYHEHVTVNKSVTVMGEGRDSTAIDGSGVGSGFGGLVTVTADNVQLQNFTIRDSAFSAGILFQNVSHCLLDHNVVVNNSYGIGFYRGNLDHPSFNNTVSRNLIANNTEAATIGYPGYHVNTTICDNTIVHNGAGINWVGVEEGCFSTQNLILRNTIAYNAESAISFFGYKASAHVNTILDNNITYNDVGIQSHLTGDNSTIRGNLIASNRIGIDLLLTAFNAIQDNRIEGNTETGIRLRGVSNTLVSANNITDNLYGACFDLGYFGALPSAVPSSNNSICENTFLGNEVAIQFGNASDNRIYHNSFIDNVNHIETESSENVWDDGYLSGGNFWDDYTDLDQFRGPTQTIPGSDGVWDHPYIIASDNVDRYPLVTLWPLTPIETSLALEGVTAWYWTDNTTITSLVAADSDLEGSLEIITGGYYHDGVRDVAQLVVWDQATLSVQRLTTWYWTGDTCINAVAVGNVDGDAALEIVTGGSYHDGVREVAQLVVWDAETLTVEDVAAWYWTNDTEINAVTLGDVDDDGVIEVITAGYYNDGMRDVAQLVVWDAATLTVDRLATWYWTGDTRITAVAVANVDGDAALEIITGGYYTDGTRRAQLVVWDGETLAVDGVTAWYWTSDTEITSVAVADVDDDAELEIVTGGSYNDGVREVAQLVTWTGSTLAVEDVAAWYWTADTEINAVAIGNVDADAGVEIVTGGYYRDGVRDVAQLVIWDGATLTVDYLMDWYWTGDTRINAVAIGNVDSNGAVEIVTGGSFHDGFRTIAQLPVWVITRMV